MLFLAYRPWPGPDESGRWSAEAWLSLCLGLAALQIVPLPRALVDLVSPHAWDVWSRLVLEVAATPTISVDLDGSFWALLVGGTALATFMCARHVFGNGGVRRVTRAMAAIGFTVSLIALAQEATGGGRMYWRWAPQQEGAPPFGPFVNRNDFGTWVVLAIPAVLGYLIAHAAAHHHHRPVNAPWRARLRVAADARGAWLLASVAAMTVALALTLSRSAMFGLAVACVTAMVCRSADGPERRFHPGWTVGAVLLIATAVFINVSPETLVARFSQAPVSAAGRWVIWRETLPVLRDFWLTGTGAGTYETVMLVYQRTMPGVRFNTAHNHYLQFAAEGGLLLGVPFVLAVRAFWREARAALAEDMSGMYFLRAGSVCGLAGAAAQSLWDTGLTTPANACLAAILAAIVVHAPIRNRAADQR